MFLCFISLLIYYIKPLHNCYNNKYGMCNLSDNLVLAVPLHSIALWGQPASLHTLKHQHQPASSYSFAKGPFYNYD